MKTFQNSWGSTISFPLRMSPGFNVRSVQIDNHTNATLYIASRADQLSAGKQNVPIAPYSSRSFPMQFNSEVWVGSNGNTLASTDLLAIFLYDEIVSPFAVSYGLEGNTFVQPVGIALTGGIFQGSGTFDTPITGLKIWNDNGTPRIDFYENGVIQADFDPSGMDLINPQGLGGGSGNTINWKDPGTQNTYARIRAYWDDIFNYQRLELWIKNRSAGVPGLFRLLFDNTLGGSTQDLQIYSSGGIYWTGNLQIDGTIDRVPRQIYRNVIGTATPTIDWQNIPAGFSHLEIVVMGRTSANVNNAGVTVRFNNDSGANYHTQYHWVAGAVSTPGELLNGTYIYGGNLTGAAIGTPMSGGMKILIPHYTSTTFYKSLISDDMFNFMTTNQGLYREKIGGQWRNSAAINRITLGLTAGNFVSDCIATLYGIP